MKITSFILIFSLQLITNIYSKCDYFTISVFPKSQFISENSIFIIEASYFSKLVLDSIGTKHQCTLIGIKDTVKLIPEKYLHGEKGVSQLLLKPERNLKLGETYNFDISNIPKWQYRYLKKWNHVTKNSEPLNWTVTDSIDLKPPLLSFPIKFLESNNILFGCGRAKYSKFLITTNEKFDYLVFIELLEIETNKTTSYYIQQFENTISIGHGMCNGPFNFIQGMTYKFKFQIVDSSGNKSRISNWINCPNPN